MRRLLIIEDTDDFRDLLALALAAEGFEVDSAPNISQALVHLHRAAYDAVIADLLLGHSGGRSAWQLLGLVKEAAAPAPVIVMTGFTPAERWDELGSLGTETVTYLVPGTHPVHSREVVGRSAFTQLAADTFRAFVRPTFTEIRARAVGGVVLVDYEGSWEDGAGARSRLPGTLVLRFEGDAIAQVGVRLDLAALPG